MHSQGYSYAPMGVARTTTGVEDIFICVNMSMRERERSLYGVVHVSIHVGFFTARRTATPLMGLYAFRNAYDFVLSHNACPISTMGFGTSTCGAADFPRLTRRRIIVTRRLTFLLARRSAPPYAL